MSTYTPHPYQKQAIEWILDNPSCGLFLDMGLGKTSITLTALKILLDRFEVFKILIIAPLRVAERTWTDEIDKWEHLDGIRVSKILGARGARVKALNVDADIYLINRENIPWLIAELDVGIGNAWPFDMVVIDELSSFKSHAANRFKALKRFIGRSDRVVGLTGTPAPNGLIDLWAQMFLLDRGERLGKKITHYRSEYFTEGRKVGNVVHKYVARDGSESIIYDKIGDICLSMRAVDHLDMPELLYVNHEVEFSDSELAQYKEFEKECYLQFINGDEITALTKQALVNKLLQFSNGAVYGSDRAYTNVSDAKLDALEDIVEAANGKPLLICYSYIHDKERIKERFKFAQDLDQDKWLAGEQQIALCHPASAGHGLNLQTGAGHQIVWYGCTWSLELYQQAIARLWRQGQQSETVIVHHLLTKGTQDSRVLTSVQGKTSVQDDLIIALGREYNELR